MLRKTPGPRGFPTEVAHTLDGAILRVPLGSGDELVGWLSIEYKRDDPLVVSIAVRAPSRAIVLERTMLRMDLRNALNISIHYQSMTVEPGGARSFTSFQFEERLVIITTLVPSDVIERFLRATDDVVPPGQPETEAVSSMLQDLLQDSGA
ncbi:MAG TPA: SsgA family sporulation/cell division regulator [Candidatus Elarobacter sp.]|nr:MAG: SsgA family sporulation/cell division regulator [Actinomycetota bacterium]HZW52740.1 SsgA family sporulation/cell division regulator [Candidatus Elarobacter sp.]